MGGGGFLLHSLITCKELIKENHRLRANVTSLQGQVADYLLRSATCGFNLDLALERISALTIAVAVVSAWFLTEHLLRPLWTRWTKAEFPVDRYIN